MRTLIIIILTLAILGGGFFLALNWQGQPASVQKGGTTQRRPIVTEMSTSRPSDAPNAQQQVGSGVRPSVLSYDKKTGELSNEFRAEKYEPTAGDLVNVTAPEAKFYLGKTGAKQLLTIKGVSGKVLIPNSGKGDKFKTVGGAPTRGDLQQVTIQLFEKVGDTVPQITCTMPNASFDNDQFRIFTDAYQDHNGRAVPGDQVPVHVTGTYEFDGRGLEIKWNELDRRLQSLEVMHGERLVINDIKSLKLSGQSTLLPGMDDALADADPKALPEAVKKKRKKKPSTQIVPGKNKPLRDRSVPVYRATFFDDVKIYEADAQIGTANQLLVDFLMDLSQKPTTAPSTQPSARHDKGGDNEGDIQLIAMESAKDQPAISGPITVKWTGKLLVQPLDDPSEAPEPGETNIGLLGSPVFLDRQGSQITGAVVTYRTGDSGFSASSDEKTPQVTMKDARGATLTTKSIDFNGVGEPAILEGKSHAEFLLKGDDPTKPAQTVKADWEESCALQLMGDSVDKLIIQQADLKGNVTLNHPQMNGRSDALSISFEPDVSPSNLPTTSPTTQPAMTVKQMLASGGVDYTITDDKQQSQSIQTQQLTVVTAKGADGKMYASSMNAEGAVHTRDAEREMFAGRLAVKLAPKAVSTTQPSQNIDVESLHAEEGVKIVTAKGQTATADRLTLTNNNGSRQIELMGLPVATVSDSQSTLSGPTIRFDPDLGNASVIGAGSLSAIQQTTPSAKPRKINARWEGDLQLQGKDNLATINGPVTIDTPSDDGSISTATGKTLVITLADAPSTQPSSKTPSGVGDISGFSNKVIQTYTLKDNVEVKSILTDAAGAILRRMHVFTGALAYDQQTKRLTIPGKGRMLMQDDRAQTTSSATQPTLLGDGGMRGATAFEWQKQMSYDETAGRIDLNGSVRVVHKGSGDEKGDSPFEVTAEQMSADIAEPSPTAPADGADQSKLELKKLHAKGGVQFNSAQLQFGADQVEYDPAAHRLTATAAPGRFAELFEQGGVSRGSFSQLIFNTETNQIESMKDFRATVAR